MVAPTVHGFGVFALEYIASGELVSGQLEVSINIIFTAMMITLEYVGEIVYDTTVTSRE
jgi:hypothetical protein